LARDLENLTEEELFTSAPNLDPRPHVHHPGNGCGEGESIGHQANNCFNALDVIVVIEAMSRRRAKWLEEVESPFPRTQSSYPNPGPLGEFPHPYLHT
jgi:hypothetical protein